mmetsp:Transcript_14558/g.19006  ORF Transcript_14558/g.19006 Transcript_14558/m.19006 type:complete len:262 (+) Transcript_14558:207-992(+)|eukprot:CAMPEP_0198145146 /NCGR_PEP_ID=MMETSP1443-20131203/21247_1 /TAXON_ID=186043 /ORGANISM="Entomoneis sp., Strain CCMP2396" /LENGTH=261 /DNA_ID=CAMNT_0043808689 /DNA_START=114 /DNA_END=899 /DNA_ORIENTATION=+
MPQTDAVTVENYHNGEDDILMKKFYLFMAQVDSESAFELVPAPKDRRRGSWRKYHSNKCEQSVQQGRERRNYESGISSLESIKFDLLMADSDGEVDYRLEHNNKKDISQIEKKLLKKMERRRSFDMNTSILHQKQLSFLMHKVERVVEREAVLEDGNPTVGRWRRDHSEIELGLLNSTRSRLESSVDKSAEATTTANDDLLRSPTRERSDGSRRGQSRSSFKKMNSLGNDEKSSGQQVDQALKSEGESSPKKLSKKRPKRS